MINKRYKKEAVMLHSLNMPFREKEDREKVRRKVVPLIKKANKEANRRHNLTRKESKMMGIVKRRRDILLQPVSKGGSISVMEKQCYK